MIFPLITSLLYVTPEIFPAVLHLLKDCLAHADQKHYSFRRVDLCGRFLYIDFIMDSVSSILLNFILAILSGIISGVIAAFITDRFLKKSNLCIVRYNFIYHFAHLKKT